MILAMAADVVITLVGYLLTAGVTLCWVFMSRQKRVPRTRRTIISVSLRILPVFLLLFIVCQRLEINVIAAFAVLAMVCWLILISPGLFGLGGIGVLYVVQQWILIRRVARPRVRLWMD
jgi:hypothetical protein